MLAAGNIVSLTDAAADRVKELMAAKDKGFLRVGVKNGGCAGMEYTMDFVAEPEKLDERVEDKGVEIVVDSKAVLFLLGATICIASQQCRTRIEANVRKWSTEYAQKFDEACKKEFGEWLNAEAIKLVFKAGVPAERILKMRFAQTWKSDGRAKARLVLQGFSDLGRETQRSGAPTISRRGHMLFCAACAWYGFTIEKGDVVGAFFRSSASEEHRHVVGLPPVWVLRGPDNRVIGLVVVPVGDSRLVGNLYDVEYRNFRTALGQLYRWQPWKTRDFDPCGVRVTQQDPDAAIRLGQEASAEHIKPIRITANQRSTQEAPASKAERSQLRALLGSLQRRGTQSSPWLQAELSVHPGSGQLCDLGYLEDKLRHHSLFSWTDTSSPVSVDPAWRQRSRASRTALTSSTSVGGHGVILRPAASTYATTAATCGRCRQTLSPTDVMPTMMSTRASPRTLVSRTSGVSSRLWPSGRRWWRPRRRSHGSTTTPSSSTAGPRARPSQRSSISSPAATPTGN